jgi:hypothetical protein
VEISSKAYRSNTALLYISGNLYRRYPDYPLHSLGKADIPKGID